MINNSDLDDSLDDRPIASRKEIRSCTQHSIGNFASVERFSPTYCAFLSNLDQVQILSSIDDALNDQNWKAAVLEEIKALEKNNTWCITNLPSGKKPVGCKWIFRVKHDGNIERLKARLVVKGYTQSYDIDYQETFAPVARLNNVRVLISIAANSDWPLYQIDVKNGFFNGDLEEEVYMKIPSGFEPSVIVNKVCRLQKSLYGL